MWAPRLAHNLGPQRDPSWSSSPSPTRGWKCRSFWNYVFALLALLLVAAPVVGQQDLIVGIVIHGNRRIPADTVKARIFSKVGDVYDAAAIERDFNALWNTGYFEDIRFEREQSAKGWILHIYLKERPTIREINYTGLNAVSTSDVLDRFKDRKVGLSVESQYDPTKIKKAEVTLKGLLAEHGRQFATIRTEVRPIPPNAVGITFVVREGPKVKVGHIRFRGNKHINDRTLRAAMKNLKPIGIPHSIFLENLFAKTYDATKLEEDTERVRAEFQNRGYFKVLVDDPKTEIHDTGHTGFHIPWVQPGLGKSVDITMPIEEGDRYRLGTITFKNNKAIPSAAALRSLFAMKDGEIFSREKVAKGLENLRKAYGEAGYINFTSVPDTKFDDEKKIVNLEIDVDEGKQFYVRRIEFTGNTTTRDKVIRREIALEEGQIYNSRYWELSLMRLNQLGYFEQLKPEDQNTTERHLDEKAGTVDLTLKVHEKGKNSIGLQGGVSGLAGAFVGINYSTNNFLGLGETLSVQASLGARQRDLVFGFTEPYLFDRPIQAGFNVYARKTSYDQARQYAIATGQNLNLPSVYLQNLQNYSQSSTGLTTSVSYPLRKGHSFKRLGISYSFDRSSLVAVSNASKLLFENLNFSGITGPNALNGIITSKITPSFTMNTLDAAYAPHHGKSLFIGGEFAGLGGTVHTIRPIIQYKQFFPMQKRRNAFGYNVQASFITGYNGVVAPPFERAYLGGENDIRGFDIRTVSPIAYLPSAQTVALRNQDGSFVPANPRFPVQTTSSGTCASNCWNIPVPYNQLVTPGGDLSLTGNMEYRITIAGPVAIAPFVDMGINPILRPSQLQTNIFQYDTLINTLFGCPQLNSAYACTGGVKLGTPGLPLPPQNLSAVPGTNWVVRMSTGLELQTMLPVLNAPFRIYYAYNALRLDSSATPPIPITRSMFPCPVQGDPTCTAFNAGTYTYDLTKATLGSAYTLREPRKTFRFTVATTF